MFGEIKVGMSVEGSGRNLKDYNKIIFLSKERCVSIVRGIRQNFR